ncbi:MAG TPA: hypothetical protein VFU36_08840 [Jatrophihabitans sp.]|nr:hypothetical protein [Jatrophihabitans sp.]
MSTETGPGVRTEIGSDSHRLPIGLVVLGMALFAVAGMLAGLIEVTLIPLRYGTALIPLAPVLAVLTGVLLPAIGRGLTDTARAAAPPAFGQLLTIWLLATGRPEGDVLLPAGDIAGVSYAVLILGTLVPLIMLGFASRPGPWRWPLGGWATMRRSRVTRRRPGRLRQARHGSDSDGAR